jgi:hypothetical protein
MLETLQTWWQNTSPEMQAAFFDGGVALAALLGGYFLGAMVARGLRARNFDAVLRLPSSSPPSPEAERGFTPAWVAGILVRLTVWAGAASWLANKHGWTDLGHTLLVITNRTWAVTAMLVAALTIGSLLARPLIECLHGPAGAGAEPVAPSHIGTARSQQRGVWPTPSTAPSPCTCAGSPSARSARSPVRSNEAPNPMLASTNRATRSANAYGKKNMRLNFMPFAMAIFTASPTRSTPGTAAARSIR